MKKDILSLYSFFSLFLFLISPVYAQNAQIDSLMDVLKTAKEDTSKVKTLNTLSGKLAQMGDFDQAKKYAVSALSLSEKIKFKKGEALANRSIGIIYRNQGNNTEALKSQFASLKICEEIKDKQGIANAYNSIGSLYGPMGNYLEALKYFSNALKITEEINDENGVALSYNNIGIIYEKQGDYSQALINHLASLKIREETKDKNGAALSYSNIGVIYEKQGDYSNSLKNHYTALKIWEELGDKKRIAGAYTNISIIYRKQENYAEALKNNFAALKIYEEIKNKKGMADSYGNIGNSYYNQKNYTEALNNYFAALEIAEAIGDKGTIGISTGNIGAVYREQGNYQEALKISFKSLKISEELGDKEGIARDYINLGALNIKLNKNSEARKYFNMALTLSKQIGNKFSTKESYNGLSELDSTEGNFLQALEHYKMYTLYKDSLLNEENNKQIARMKTQYETEKKDNEIIVLNKDKLIQEKEITKQKLVRNGFVGGFGLMLLFAGVFFTQRNRISKEKQRSEELLLNILPEEVANEIKSTGSAKARSYDDVTVMFTDFKNFTQASEKMSAETLVKEINHCYSAFDKIISKHGIEKIKTIGDSYMCAGGLPVQNKTHPHDVVNAALELQQFMAQHKRERIANGEPCFELRLGIHTGPVVAGIVGIKKFAYDIWGDTVNTASRMESSGEVGKVNISGSTYDLVKDKFTCIHRGKVEAKSMGMIDMYFVEERNAA